MMDCAVLLKSVQFVPSILKALASHAYNDVTLVCGGGDQVHVSSLVLAFLSPGLGNLLKENSKLTQGELCVVLPIADAGDVRVVLANLFRGEGQVDQTQIQKISDLLNPIGTNFVKSNNPQKPSSSENYNAIITRNMERKTSCISEDHFCNVENDPLKVEALKVEPEVMIKEEPTEIVVIQEQPGTSSNEQSNFSKVTEKYGSMKKYLKFIELKEKELKAKRSQPILLKPIPKAILTKPILPKPILPKSPSQPALLTQAREPFVQAVQVPTMEVCKFCAKDFLLSDTASKKEFKKHMQLHVIETMSCDCDFGGETDTEKNFHIKCFHLGHFGCEQCSRTFQTRSSLSDHHQINHSENLNEKFASKKNNIEVGETFANQEEVEIRIQLYSDSNFSPFVRASAGFRQSRGTRRLVFKCPFGIYRKSQSAGIRQVTSRYVGCPVTLNINQQKDNNSYVVGKAVLEHQEHEVGEEMYAKYRKRLTKDQEEAVVAFLESGPSNKEVSSFIMDLTGKEYSIRDAGALARKLKKRNK